MIAPEISKIKFLLKKGGVTGRSIVEFKELLAAERQGASARVNVDQ